MAQIADAATIAEIKYTREKGYRVMLIFDHSSCHGAYALNANKQSQEASNR